MCLQQLRFEAVPGSSFGTSTFSHSSRTDVSVDLLAKRNGATTMVGAARLSGASGTNCNAARRALHGRELPSTSAANLTVIRSVIVHEYFFHFAVSIVSVVARNMKLPQN